MGEIIQFPIPKKTINTELFQYDDDIDIYQYRFELKNTNNPDKDFLIEEIKKLYGKPNLEEISEYLHYKKKSCKSNTIRSYAYFIKKVLLNSLTITYRNSFKKEINEFFKEIIPTLKKSSNKLIPTREELAKFFSFSTKRVSLISKLLFYSGARVSELCNIRLKDVIIKNKYAILKIYGKGGYYREIIIDKKLITEIKSFFQSKEYLIESSSHKKYNRKDLYKLISNQSKKILGYAIGPHTFRHCFATYSLEDNPKNIHYIMQHGGWQNAEVFINTYLHNKKQIISISLPEIKITEEHIDNIPQYANIKSLKEFKKIKNRIKMRKYRKRKKEKKYEC